LQADESLRHERIFHSGQDGYPRFRIPSLVVTTQGTVLAICEGRVDGGGLQGNVDLVLRRSLDNGKSWSPIQVVADAGRDTLGNPCAVLDRETGFVWLALTHSPGEFTEAQIRRGESKGLTKVFVTHSEDDGETWARPRDITANAKRAGWTWYGTGPGVGIQLADGRLFIPSYHTEADRGTITRSHAIFSDDHGKTWQLGGSAGIGNGECQALERRDGTIYLSARTAAGGPNHRSIMTSADRGASWSKKTLDETLFDPHCEASLLKLTIRATGKPRVVPLWLYCHPAGPKRHNLTIRISLDEGRTWPDSFLLRKGNGQYTSMAALADGRIGVLYDCWEENNYQLYFARVELSDLL
jgi:sialidase-1